MFLNGFFENGERPNDETVEDSKMANEEKATFKRKYQECYLEHKFTAAGDTFSSTALYNPWRPGTQRSFETFKTALPHGDQAPCIKRQAFGDFKIKKKCEHEEQKQLLKVFINQMYLHWEHHS